MLEPAETAKRLLILGASGGIGLCLIEQALERGHRVTAFVRAPYKITTREGLTILRGDPLDSHALGTALAGHDAVLSALGPPGPGPTTIVGDGARSTVTAMHSAGIRRLVVVGVAVLFDDIGLVASILRHTLLRNVAKDSAEMERIVTASDLDWTIVRPPRLTNGPLTRLYSVADDHLPPGAGSAAAISRADVAHFILGEVEHGEHVRRIIGIARRRAAPRRATTAAPSAP